MTAVVTGASGHIGANLVRGLLRRGLRVRALIHANTGPLDGLDVELVRGDLLDPATLGPAFAGADVVYHLAGVISIDGDRHGRMRAVNVDGTEHATRTASEAGVRRFVHCSSIHAFDLGLGGRTVDETTPRIPDSPRGRRAYDRAKAEGDRRVLAAVDRGLDAVIVHPTSVIGPYDFEPSRMGRLFLMLARRTIPGLVAGGFDFVDVRDVADGLIAAADRGNRGESYLLAGHHHSIRELAEIAGAVTGSRPPRLTVPIGLARLGVPAARLIARLRGTEPLYTAEALEILHGAAAVDDSKAERELGHRARPTEETVRDLYRWFAETGRMPVGSIRGGG